MFTAAMIGGGGVAGSAVSVLLSGALLAGLWRLWQGLIALPRDRVVRLIGATLAAHFAAESLSTLVNLSAPEDLLEGIVANIPFLSFLVIFARLSLTSREDVLRWVDFGAIGGGIGAGLYALVEALVLRMPRAEGLAGNSGPFALVCALLFAFCVAASIREHGRVRSLAAVGAALAAVGLVLSGMRSLWPMLAISPVLVLWVYGGIPRRLPTLRVMLGCLAAALLLAVVGYGTIERRVTSLVRDVKLVSAGQYDNSLGLRLRVWSAAAALAAEKPVFGQGPGLAQAAMRAESHVDGEREITFTHAHNMFLNAMMRSGIFGLAAVVAMFIVPLWLAGRAQKDATGRAGYALMTTLVATYLVNGAVNISLGHDIIDAVFIYGMVVGSYLVFGPSSAPRFEQLADGRRVEREAMLADGDEGDPVLQNGYAGSSSRGTDGE